MKATMQLNISQQLTLTPQLQQAIRLLQLSSQDLNIEIQEALESNPMLEISSNDHDITVEKKNSDSLPNESSATPEASFHEHYASASHKMIGQDINYENFIGSDISLRDHLLWQLDLTPMTELDQIIAYAIIDDVNDEGFLTHPPEEIFAALQATLTELELDEFEAVRHRLMRFDPLGVCSENLAECLLTQLAAMPSTTPFQKLAMKMIAKDIKLLGQHNYRKLIQKYHISQETLQSALNLIQTLNPSPGTSIQANTAEYISPDVTVSKENGQWVVRLNNDVLPQLSINGKYASMIQRADNSKDNVFLKNNLQEARWFLKSIQSRQETLFKVACSIVELQNDFLEQGEESMKPLILNDIAEKLGMHESTISRVTTQKYIHTPRGVFELKYFFSSHLSTKTGGECSSTAIRAVIKKLISDENIKKPLSDSKISLILKDKGINVARRTVAKYRETMGIPPSNERKGLGMNPQY